MATDRFNIGTKFETGDIPSQSDFKEIFDSFVHKDEDKADFQMVEAGISNEHYVTPALLYNGLKNIGIITGNCYMPHKEYFESTFSGTTLSLEKLPIKYSVKLYKNGQLLQEGEDYAVDYNTAVITFSAPVSDRNLEVNYWYKNLGPNPGGEAGEPIDFTSFLHTSGNETKNGLLTFNNTTAASTSGIVLTNSATGTASASLDVNVSGTGNGVSVQNSATGKGVKLSNTGAGVGAYLNSASASVGDVLQVAKDDVVKTKIDANGIVTAPKFVTSGGTASEFVKGDGSLDNTVYAKDTEVLHTTGNESKDGALTLTHDSSPQDVLTISKNNSANCLKLVQNSNSNATTSTWDTSTANVNRKAISIKKQENEKAFITHDGNVTATSFTTLSSKADITDGLLSLASSTSPTASQDHAKLYAKNDGTNTDMYVMGSDGVEKKIDGGSDLSDYAKLASPAFTGVPTAPTAVAGTNTMQIASTEFVQSALNNTDSGNIKTSGFQSGLTGLKVWENESLETINGAKFINSYPGSYFSSSALIVENASGSSGLYGINKSTGSLFTLNSEIGSGGSLISFCKDGTEKASINAAGEFKGAKFIVTGGTFNQFLKADGSRDFQIYTPRLLSIPSGSTETGLRIENSNSSTALMINSSYTAGTGATTMNINVSNGKGILGQISSGQDFLNIINGSSGGSSINITNTNASTSIPFLISKNTTERFRISDLGIITGNGYNLAALHTAPASSTATGILGEIRVTSSYIYVCIAANTWVRSALTSW